MCNTLTILTINDIVSNKIVFYNGIVLFSDIFENYMKNDDLSNEILEVIEAQCLYK